MAARARLEPDPALVARVAAIAAALPEAEEEDAWTGVRWQVRRRTFAHVMVVQPGFSAAQRVLGDDPDAVATLLTVHAEGEDLLHLHAAGSPFHPLPWSPTTVGVVLDHPRDPAPDWDEITELVRESYRVRAPLRLRRSLDDTPPGGR